MCRFFTITIMIITGVLIGFPAFTAAETDIRYTDDGFKITHNERWIKIGGVVMWDMDAASGAFWDFEDDNDNWHTRSELRRARLNIKTRLSDNWKAKVQVDYDNEDESVGIKDAYIEYGRWETANIIAGKDKEPFGLENLSSSKNLVFVERSLATSAFSPGRHIGISIKGRRDHFTWQTGVYQAESRKDERDTYATTGRLTFIPWRTATGFFHVGISGSYRDFDGEKFEIDEPAQVNTADLDVFSDKIDTDHLLAFGMETAFGYGPFSFSGEYMATDVHAVEKSDDAAFSGWYLSFCWLLTGEFRVLRNGTWKRVIPESRYGAWELAARYGCLDAGHRHSGTNTKTSTLGVNWFLNPHISLMTDYTYLWLTDAETGSETTADAVSFRIQYVF